MHVKGQIEVRLQLTPEARDFIARWLETTDFDDPIVGIGWGRWHDERVEHWLIGLYSRRRSSGWLCKAPGLEFLVVDQPLIERLQGRTLDLVEHRAVVR